MPLVPPATNTVLPVKSNACMCPSQTCFGQNKLTEASALCPLLSQEQMSLDCPLWVKRRHLRCKMKYPLWARSGHWRLTRSLVGAGGTRMFLSRVEPADEADQLERSI